MESVSARRAAYVSGADKRGRRRMLALLLGLALACAAAALLWRVGAAEGAATLPPGFSQSVVTGGLDRPTAMALAPDGRIFVAQQGGKLRVVKDGTLLQTPFLSLNVDSSGERGLLGVALDPDFASNGYVYVYYTAKQPRVHNRIARFTADGDVALAGSGKKLLDLNVLSQKTNHNGGALHFGEDGKLYAAVGENANPENAQTLRNLKGKMLRLNEDGTIPRDNPFYGRAKGKNRAIWALGLRNPYSFAVRPGTGEIFINDVGQKTWEEINRGRAGANYGWPRHEGPESERRYKPPIFAYRHGETGTTGCAITGGAFYNPQTARFPASYVGDYFFADFCNGWIRRYDPATDKATAFARGLSFVVDLRVADDGSLYYLSRGSGSLNRIRYTGS
jgi:glucose/arabinose dehydrogenase